MIYSGLWVFCGLKVSEDEMSDILFAFMGATVCITLVCFGLASDFFCPLNKITPVLYRLGAALFGVAITFALGFTWYRCIVCIALTLCAFEWISNDKSTTQ